MVKRYAWLGCWALGVLGGVGAAQAGGCGGEPGATQCTPRSPAYVRQAYIGHKGDLVFSDQPLGVQADLALRLTEEERVTPLATSFGQWRDGLVGYVTTAEQGEAVPPGMSQVRLYEAAGGYRVYQRSGQCPDTGDCVYERDELGGTHLLRMSGGSVLPLGTEYRVAGAELGAARVRELLEGMRAEDRARTFVRTRGGEGYEVYGQVRELLRDGRVTGHEAWLSHVVDRLGGVVRMHYDTSDAMLRLAAIEDADGLKTRFFYADTEPLSAGEPLSGFADPQLPDALKGTSEQVPRNVVSLNHPQR